jgi:hypothetical protein
LGTFDFYQHLRFTSCPTATHDYSNMRSLIRLVTFAPSINLLISHRLFDDYVGCMSVGDKQSGSVSKSSGVTLLYSGQHKAERQRSVHQRLPIIHLPIYHLRISGLYHTGEELPAVGEATQNARKRAEELAQMAKCLSTSRILFVADQLADLKRFFNPMLSGTASKASRRSLPSFGYNGDR